MKVDPANHAQANRSAKARAASVGPSFARLIEAGAGAAQITAKRALGFGEAGVLGLHAAVAEATPTVHVLPSSRLNTPTSPALQNCDSGSMRSGAEQFTGQREQTSARAKPAVFRGSGLVETRAVAGPAGDAAMAAIAAVPTEDTSRTSNPSTRSSELSAAPSARKNLKLDLPSGRAVRFRLLESHDGFIAVVTSLDFATDEAGELLSLSETIGREFGVTVRKIVTRLSAANPRGNP